MYVTLLQVHSWSLCCRIAILLLQVHLVTTGSFHVGLRILIFPRCCRIVVVYSVGSSSSVAAGLSPSMLQDHSHLCCRIITVCCCRIRTLLQDHHRLLLQDQDATAGSICYDLKWNQRGPVASYHEPFISVAPWMTCQFEMLIPS